MKMYYESQQKNVFDYLPLTFHIQEGINDPEYKKFLQSFNKNLNFSKSNQNIWIVKPGELSNRGTGINIIQDINSLNDILKI